MTVATRRFYHNRDLLLSVACLIVECVSFAGTFAWRHDEALFSLAFLFARGMLLSARH